MLLIGVDDTDSPEGGCTTALAAILQDAFPELTPEGPPRLVRLNPNVPWKTRGNAAIALRFAGDFDPDAALARVVEIVQRETRPHATTSPGVVVSFHPLPAELYEAAVTRIVEREEVESALKLANARWWGGRGVTGAAAAIAWPGKRATWERIAYRDPSRLGTPRDVDDAWAREIEWTYPSTFDSYDLHEKEVVCVPGGPDPVLWGIRGEEPADLEKASAVMGPERPARETLFLTNQASDDHLRDLQVKDVRDMDSARVRGKVSVAPRDQHGTVFLEVDDGTGAIRAAAFPPTHGFRQLVRMLDVGDEVTVCGGVHVGPDGRITLGLEKLCLHHAAPRKAGPPACPQCGRSMKSAGHGAGYRCRECGTKAKEARTADAALAPGWHEVPAVARRHLAMPLKRAPKA